MDADIGNATLRLADRGATIRVDADGSTAAMVNTRTFAVTTDPFVALSPSAVAASSVSSASIRPAPRSGGTGGAGNVPWLVLAAAAALAVVGGAVRLRAKLRIG